jgi:acyl dehydratase
VQLFCGHEPARLRSIRARLTSPVYPGETLVLECWRVAADEVSFRARVKERDVVVLNNGRARIAA